MRKIFAFLTAALIAASSTHFATAAERHHGKVSRATVSQQQRNSDAYAAWPAPTAQPDTSRYSGGYSAPAGR